MRSSYLLGAALLAVLAPRSIAAPTGQSSLFVAGSNISRGGNFYVYYAFANKHIKVAAGDKLEYDIFITGQSPETNGGVDVGWTDGSLALRELDAKDQNGLKAHPNTELPQAKNKWYHRVIGLDLAAGKTTDEWDVVLEGDTPGPYAFFVGDIGIHHADGTWDYVYDGGPVEPGAHVAITEGYSQKVIVRPVDTASIAAGPAVDKLIASTVADYDKEQVVGQLAHDVDMVDHLLKGTPEEAAIGSYVTAARAEVEKVKADPQMSAQEMTAHLNTGRAELAHTHEFMRSYTGYLVGHAHIDFQWLWEWPESIEVCDHTFGQAVKFMDEFPGFSFSQSSSALYKVTQEHFPALFKKIQEKVKAGQWDIVGGRVCEGDENQISEESHARHFLLGQRYFRKNFAKTATVGWEPDTFGHTWSMPEILKMGGIDNFYFCRGGKGKPLFWWEGPDGTRALTFDEPASGSWYNASLDNSTLNELFPWRQNTGLKDILWVYGVGNHGGGPTREHINTAEDWMKGDFFPTVKFATAGKFFTAIRKKDLTKIPVISDELNGIFDGCYTTHSDMKRMNRDAENITATAESITTAASLYGQPYPADRFDALWEEICFNHHHDTLPGSAIHESYVKSREQLGSIIAESRNIAGDSLRFLATLTTHSQGDDYNVIVFNPLGWTHGGQVTLPWPFRPDTGTWTATAPDGTTTPITVIYGLRIDNPTAEPNATFRATDVPGFGYSTFVLKHHDVGETLDHSVSIQDQLGAYVLENDYLRATVASDTGLVTSLFDKRQHREMVAPNGAANRLEIWWEKPEHRDAWSLGDWDHHDNLTSVQSISVIESGPGRATVQIVRKFQDSTITQRVSLSAASDQLDLPVWIDWQEVNRDQPLTPMLKIACDVAGQNLVSSYEIPYATIHRPTDGAEVVALKSADLSGTTGGITMLNDCKSGHAADGNTLRLSLVRTPGNPDNMPDQRFQVVNVALWPHEGGYGAASMRKGFEFNQTMVTARVPPTASGQLPMMKSFMEVHGDTVIPTVMKRAEEDQSAVVVRMFEGGGAPASVTVTPGMPVASTRWVNFVEDPLSEVAPGATAGASLHKYEIRNLELFAPKMVATG